MLVDRLGLQCYVELCLGVHISDCKDLTSLSVEIGSWKNLSSLKMLSIRGCSKLGSLTDEGLPTAIDGLSFTEDGLPTSLGQRSCMLETRYLIQSSYLQLLICKRRSHRFLYYFE
ncbi:uncharacterized protein LOC111277779 [Durio zibethinus]|uniref:Uncharacterized protein LOC111277779 n=1 Tax=Durio zibethinus TaxID=66656 RepID=A0A6P5WWR1_DURZI|nr:uncharacterized protein LOC111277779 [Durio zibethinus]